MKIYKQKEHALLIKTFAIGSQQYFAPTVMVYFDLTAPDGLLTEQELWKNIPAQLGPTPILDQGMPKPHGEFLVTGQCHAPRGETRSASLISVTVGDNTKKLMVFGPRYWTKGGAISDPQLFSSMPVTWENAFGGQGFDLNPLGKGLHPADVTADKYRIPLPNIENPTHVIGVQADRPKPAGYGPLDMMWPQRHKKTGTYNEHWLKERWPNFPEDMDYSFFNAASDDQQIRGYFQGDEAIEIENMHPDYRQLVSRLPGVRIRCFATILKDFKPFTDRNEFTEVFQEIGLHIDTVWLFPSILRGIAMFRGSTPVVDDEYGDLARLFVATEQMTDPPKSVEEYFEAQKKALDRSVPIDMAPLQNAQKKISEALVKLKKLPKEIQRAKQTALGKTPVMTRTPEEMSRLGQDTAAGGLAVIDNLEAMALRMQKRWGHKAEIDLTKFDRLRENIRAATARLDQAAQKIADTEKKALRKKADILKKHGEFLKTNLTPEQLAEHGIDPDNPLPEEIENPWHEGGMPFVVACRKNLEQHPEAGAVLRRMGLKPGTMRRAWLGFNPEARTFEGADWGLAPEEGRAENQVHIQAGLVLPRFQDADLSRILVRTHNPEDRIDHSFSNNNSEFLVRGSDEEPLFLAAAQPESYPVRTADELQAWFVEQEAGDFCDVVALKDPAEAPGKEAAEKIGQSELFLVLMPAGSTTEDREWKAWEKAYDNAVLLTLPQGRTVFETHKRGRDIRRLILEALPEEKRREHDLEPALPKEGQAPDKSPAVAVAFPAVNIGGLVKDLMTRIKAEVQPEADAAKAEMAKATDAARTQLADHGIDLDEAMAKAKAAPRPSPKETAEELARTIESRGEALRAAHGLSPELEKKIADSAARVREIGGRTDTLKTGLLARLEAMKKEAAEKKKLAQAGRLPGKAGENMAAAGLTPDALRRLTREEVIERHKNGRSLAKTNLSGVDLSKLDLSGANFRQANLTKAILSEAVLDRADLSKVIGSEADFSKASLREAKMHSSLLMKAKFKEADLRGANLNKGMLRGADLTGADFTGAQLRMAVFEKAKMENTVFRDAELTMSIFSSTPLNGAKFQNAQMRKVVFKKLPMDKADFSGSRINSTLFWGAEGREVSFAQADMTRSRMGSQTSLPKADFTGASLQQACFRESDLSGGNFKGSVLDKAMLDGCDLKEADMYRVSAKHARLQKTNLEGADMRGMNLFLGSLRKCRLVDTDLRGSNLFSVNFYKAVVGRTKLELANLKRTVLHKRKDLIE